MAEQKFLVDINLSGQELQNAVLHTSTNASTLPGVEGQVAYDTSKKTIWYQNGTKWIEVGGILGIVETAPIKVVTNSGIATISITAATPTTTGDNGTYDGTGDGSIAGKDKEKLDKIDWGAQVDQNSDEVPHTSASSSDEAGATEVETALHNLGTTLQSHRLPISARPHNEIKTTDQVVGDITPSGATGKWADEAQIVKYVQANAVPGGRPTKAFDPTGADAGTGGFPKLAYGHPDPPGVTGTIKTGDHFILSKDGTTGGTSTLKTGDSLIARKDMTADNATAGGTQLATNWDVIKAAVIQDASYITSTTPIKGQTLQAVSTDLADVKLIQDILDEHDPAVRKGDNTRFVTPLALQWYAKKFKLLTEMSKDGAPATPGGAITHNWNNKDVSMEAWVTGTGARLIGEISITPTIATITFNKAPGVAWRMRVVGEDLS